MSFHECPIEPYDWNNGDGNASDPDDVVELCPKCFEPAIDQGDNTWKCTECEWHGSDVLWDEKIHDYEPNMDDVI